ncbi:mercuric transport protein MerTP [Arenibacter sp. GZD96]|uniref:mercuric transport protein MerTP n=1 Tax=Aurantibrevibacter litoralis TaxID=3106030 RepID=UPI002AFF47CE|nr:mercuric transport protein MerTP [Arenibacter sp. GZD-96]MEA1784655.1 mercuric transport protein MerTP [Arenibacter sp. GZD-96]
MNKSFDISTIRTTTFAGAGLLAAFSASLCCITPILALLSGTTGLAAAFSWTTPFRPYLIAISVLVLGFAWYLKLKPKTTPSEPGNGAQCDCESTENQQEGKIKKPFMQSITFLGIVTIFSALMLAFPSYAPIFSPTKEKEIVVVQATNITEITFRVNGMTCSGCEVHVTHAVHQLPGILDVTASYDDATTVVKFDSSKTNMEAIINAIKTTGYQVATQE